MRISYWSSDVCSSDLLDDVAEQLVDIGVGPGDVRPARRQAQRACLLAQVGVLAARHFMAIDVGSAGADIGLERCVATTHVFPIIGELLQRFQIKARIAFTARQRSEEHTSELQSLMRISYAVFCLKKKTIYQIP